MATRSGGGRPCPGRTAGTLGFPSRYLADMSHDLRTPIAAIGACAETLRRGVPDDADRVRFVRIIGRQCARMSSLVEDLLAVAELESGKSRPMPTAVRLRSFLQESVARLRGPADRKEVSVKVDVEKDLEVLADHAHLERAFRGLLDHAVRCSGRSGAVRLEGRRFDARRARISIRGAPAAIRGSGRGFFISKTLIEANGGRVWARGVDGRNSALHFMLPCLPPSFSAKR